MKTRAWRWAVLKDFAVTVFIGAKKPTGPSSWAPYWHNSGKSRSICKDEFRIVFGFLPPEGKPVKIEFKAKKLVTK